MRIITTKKLSDFWEKHRDVEGELKAWIYEIEQRNWNSTQDVKHRFRTADFIPGNRVVFNIKGNRYRLIVCIHYNTGIIFIRFIGTHAEYDKIDCKTI